MKKIVSIFLAAVLTFSFSLTAFAVTATDANATRDEAKVTFDNLANEKFDIDGSEQIAAADARLTLLYSAGLRNDETERAADADIDGDGKVTAIDARTILRISSKLENAASYYTDEEKLAYFNAILNTARPNNYHLYKNGIEYTANVTYTDPNGVVSALDNAFKSIDSSVDFAGELTASKGEKVYNSNTFYGGSPSSARNKMMFISNPDGIDEYQSSYLTIDDITKVEYKTNQTYTFTRYGTVDSMVDTSNVLYTESVSGLDSLTVYLKSDNDITGAHASKAFTVYNQADIEADLAQVAEQFNSMSMEFTSLYSMEFNVTPSVGGVKYYNSYITVYFDPDDGTIVSAYYSLFTDYTMGLYMDVDIFMIAPYVDVDKAGQVNITNTTQSIMEYYFIDNNPNHVDW